MTIQSLTLISDFTLASRGAIILLASQAASSIKHVIVHFERVQRGGVTKLLRLFCFKTSPGPLYPAL